MADINNNGTLHAFFANDITNSEVHYLKQSAVGKFAITIF